MTVPAFKEVNLTGNGASSQTSDWLPLNVRITPFNVGIGVTTDGSTTGYTVQYTFEDPYQSTPTAIFDHTNLTAQTSSESGNIAFPVSAVRLKVDANGTDNIRMMLIQAGY